jgi:hypothetical protein
MKADSVFVLGLQAVAALLWHVVQGPTALSVVGLSNCKLDYTVTGTVQALTFSVKDSQGAVATATRRVVVEEACITGEVVCPSGSCSEGASAVLLRSQQRQWCWWQTRL